MARRRIRLKTMDVGARVPEAQRKAAVKHTRCKIRIGRKKYPVVFMRLPDGRVIPDSIRVVERSCGKRLLQSPKGGLLDEVIEQLSRKSVGE
jgi:hypothetical protein